MCQQKPSFEFKMFVWKTCIETNKILTAKPNWPNKSLVSNSKMFEWMSWSETKFLNKSLAAKPNSANKILVSNSKCLNESLAFKLKLWRKVLLRNQTPPTKVLFRIQNVWMKVLIWNNRQKACCENKLFQQKLCFKFNIFGKKSWCETKFSRKVLLQNQAVPRNALFWIQNVWMKVLQIN